MVLAGVLSGMLGQAALSCEQLRDGPTDIVREVIDGDTLLLADGAKVRLLGVQAPKLAQGRDMDDWPLADTAREWLADRVLGQQISLRYGQAEKDRYGRLLAHGFLQGALDEDEVWLQSELLRAGLARVYSHADNRLCLEPLMRAEAQARVDKVGIWAHNYYTLQNAHNPQQLADRAGQFDLVEGAVRDAQKSGGRIYLNFGEDWDEDFTLIIESKAQRMFRDIGLDPLDLSGALIRVRGWVDMYGGPRIFVTHPEQIEVLAR